jgi:ABC-2 type transport system ATP-binding protein
MPTLQVSSLRKSYGDRLAVDDLTFSTAPGEIVGLLGPNGAGKTTTINMILGVLEPSGGRIHIEGRSLATDRREALQRTNFAAVYAPLPGNLTVEQNLKFFGMLYGVASLRTESIRCWSSSISSGSVARNVVCCLPESKRGCAWQRPC